MTFDRNIIRLRAFQNDRNNVADPTLPVLRGNHNGGVLSFGHDGKLYIIIGDEGRRGFTQNNLEGPAPDDDFGGPQPDNAHLTGVILRLNPNGTTPRDNPFFRVGSNRGRGSQDDDHDGRRDDGDHGGNGRGHDDDDDDDGDDEDDEDDLELGLAARRNIRRSSPTACGIASA